ncbi:Peptide deformylase [bioreactor metagenome]|uniref:Peptide deformylase n=1 Tax=bioreactor metagenome TaxID=1076179 RepID=A0A645DPZ9_9ZZZZ
MAIREILKEGEPTLRVICRPVTEVNERICTLLDDMLETMHEAEGVGLAAPQVGVRRRVVVIDVGDGNVYELINPQIITAEGADTKQEGCLSIPDFSGYVTRPMKLTVKALDRTGTMRKYEVSGYAARAVCHETDHLDGILFRDKIVPPPPGAEKAEKQEEENAK